MHLVLVGCGENELCFVSTVTELGRNNLLCIMTSDDTDEMNSLNEIMNEVI